MTVALQPSEARVYSVREKKDHPRIVGTSRHVMCGMFETADEAWDDGKKELSFTAHLLAVEPMTVTVSAPPGLAPAGAEADGAGVTLGTDNGAVTLQLILNNKKDADVPVTVRFK